MHAIVKWGLAISVCFYLKTPCAIQADDSTLRAELEALRAQVAQLRAEQHRQTDTWMNERRAAEVRMLVREVLADAETRASLMHEGMYAGHNGSKFFLQSADGGLLMEIDGQIQLRHTFNFRHGDGIDGDTGGFELRRTKIGMSGHIADPRIKYTIKLAVNRNDNSVYGDTITLGYQLTDAIFIWAGESKAPFLREEITSSGRQLAVERSYVNEIFTIDRAQGIGVVWQDKQAFNNAFRAQAMVNDGFRSGEAPAKVNVLTQRDDFGGNIADRSVDKGFAGDAADFALTGRVDVRLAGEWTQMRDFTSFPSESLAAFIGGAVHWELGRTGDALLNNDFILWTVDGSVEMNGFSLFGAIIAMHTRNDTAAEAVNRDLYGFVGQMAYNIALADDRSIEPFARYEHIDFDSAITDAGRNTSNSVNILTVGVNYYLKRHAAKLTFDLVWAMDPIPMSSTGLGILADVAGADDQVVIRSQFQLLF